MQHQQIKNCPICDRPTEQNIIVTNVILHSATADIVQCQDCETLYHKEYFTKEKVELFYRHFLSNVYIKSVKDNIITDYQNIYKNKKGKQYLDKKTITSGTRFKEIDNVSSGSRVLDIGSGACGIANILTRRDCEVVSLEPCLDYYNYVSKRRNIIHNITLDDYNDKDGTFDWITAGDVVEHLINPRQSVEKIYNLLKPGGSFYFTIPLAPDGIVDGEIDLKDYALQIPHFFIPTSKGIKILLKKFNNYQIINNQRVIAQKGEQ
jgi:2-polyprenyl-3-methyl-5-hydroxy-6-metoxy-1,4-benzoquinol methylase